MIKLLCVVVLSLGLASCGGDAKAAGGCNGDCSNCTEHGDKAAGNAPESCSGACENCTDAKDAKPDAATPPADAKPAEPKQPEQGK
jgi:hypothetical protein